MKKPNHQDATYSIALAGISAGLALLFVWLGVVVRYSTVAFFVAASLAVMIPMTKRYYLASLIAYGISAGLSFVITGDIITVIGYILYFGPIGLLSAFFINIKLRWWIQLIIKLVFINGILAILYYLFGALDIELGSLHVEFWMVALVGSPVLIAIDYVIQLAYRKIAQIMVRVLREKPAETVIKEENKDEEDEMQDPFDGTFGE